MSDSFVKWDAYLTVASLSDIGLRRTTNQDNLCISFASNMETWRRRGHLFIVADGMGGNAAGDLASKIAVDSIPHLYSKLLDGSPVEALRRALIDANAEIYRRGQANEEFQNMGTTCSGLLLLPIGAVVAHVGDSRVYRLRGTTLDQLTFDHSLVWEMRAAGQVSGKGEFFKFGKNYITRSLGPYPEVQVDLEGPFPIQPGDAFVLCSDGLTGQVTDEEIGGVLASLPPSEAARTLIDIANLRGGPDNITVIIVRIQHADLATTGQPGVAAGPRKRAVKASSWVLFCTALAVAALLQLLNVPLPGVAVPLILAFFGFVWIFVQVLRGLNAVDGPADGSRLGRGPHVRVDCSTSGWGLVAKLREMDREILDVIKERGWSYDQEHWRQLSSEVDKAVDEQDLAAAIRLSSRATTFLMDQIRRRDPGGTTAVDLGS